MTSTKTKDDISANISFELAAVQSINLAKTLHRLNIFKDNNEKWNFITHLRHYLYEQ